MENTLIFASEKEVRFGKLLKFIIPTYLTSLFNTVYTIIDGIFVSAYVGTNALAAINIVYPIVNVLTGIALVFATGGSAVAALHIGGKRRGKPCLLCQLCCGYSAELPCFSDRSYESIKDSDPARCNRYNDSRVQNLRSLVALGYACRDRERAVHLLYSGRRFSYIQFCNSTVRRHFEHCS